jgi:hypothetical protein
MENRSDIDGSTFMDAPDYNKFLALQLKMQKVRNGFEVSVLSPIECDAVLSLSYDLRQYVVKPGGNYPAFEAIVIPVLSIVSLTTTEPTISHDSSPQVHLRLSLPPFSISLGFSRDCRSFATFIESLEFLRVALMRIAQGERMVEELRTTNEDLTAALDQLRATKIQQDELIQELSRLVVTLTDQ